jgi:hypothetical protein
MTISVLVERTDLATTPEKEGADRCKYNTEKEEGGENSLGCENRLPCLESLLLECSVCDEAISLGARQHAGGNGDALAGRFQPPFSFFCSAVVESSVLPVSARAGLRLKRPMLPGGGCRGRSSRPEARGMVGCGTATPSDQRTAWPQSSSPSFKFAIRLFYIA